MDPRSLCENFDQARGAVKPSTSHMSFGNPVVMSYSAARVRHDYWGSQTPYSHVQNSRLFLHPYCAVTVLCVARFGFLPSKELCNFIPALSNTHFRHNLCNCYVFVTTNTTVVLIVWKRNVGTAGTTVLTVLTKHMFDTTGTSFFNCVKNMFLTQLEQPWFQICHQHVFDTTGATVVTVVSKTSFWHN